MNINKRWLKHIALITIGAFIGAFATHVVPTFLNRIETQYYNKLEYTSIAYKTTIDSMYIPLLNWKYDPKPIYLILLMITNLGQYTQSNVHVSVSNIGKVICMYSSKEAIIHTRTGEQIDVYDMFSLEGKPAADFIISSIPPKVAYSFVIMSLPERLSEFPRVTVQSESKRATRLEPEPSLKAIIPMFFETKEGLKFKSKYNASTFQEIPTK